MPFDITNTGFMQQNPLLPFHYMYDVEKFLFRDAPGMSSSLVKANGVSITWYGREETGRQMQDVWLASEYPTSLLKSVRSTIPVTRCRACQKMSHQQQDV